MERLSMKTRKELTQKVCQHYRTAGKKEKTVVLTDFIYATGYDRSYAATLLKEAVKFCSSYPQKRRGLRSLFTQKGFLSSRLIMRQA